jgi:hypothetical protein
MTAVTTGRRPAIPPEAGPLPRPRGPVSDAVMRALRRPPGSGVDALGTDAPDAWGEDAQLALYACYELHYRGFHDVDADWEWDLDLHRVRGELETRFLTALRADTGTAGSGDAHGVGAPGDVDAALTGLLTADSDDDPGLAQYLLAHPDPDLLREYVIHRSVYHLKEADPHALLIPRLSGRAKAGVVTVEFDEYGGGTPEGMHAALFADLMRGLGLDAAYGAYLDRVPAPMLAVVNLMSLFGWHRSRRAMMAGHFAAAEASTPPSAARLARALDAAGVEDPACARFFTEHIEADAVHEQLMRREVLDVLLDSEPELADDVVFGIRATDAVESRFAAHVLGAWQAGRSSLLPGNVGPGTVDAP